MAVAWASAAEPARERSVLCLRAAAAAAVAEVEVVVEAEVEDWLRRWAGPALRPRRLVGEAGRRPVLPPRLWRGVWVLWRLAGREAGGRRAGLQGVVALLGRGLDGDWDAAGC